MEMREVTDPGPSGRLCRRPRKTPFPIVQGVRLVASITGLGPAQFYRRSTIFQVLCGYLYWLTSLPWSTSVLLTLLLERRLITAYQEPRSPSYLVTAEN